MALRATRALQTRIFRLEDDAHASLAQHGQDTVHAEPANLIRHSGGARNSVSSAACLLAA